ncbi:putative quinol monooxygenase [Uliginosibacterium sp. H3]|uniref:Quinol monooxygenase n=1 Tax=Uliginosibacterium silvisoli TaxID=3114758 RepID=A0ABU6K3H7_9RHOO|nr:putative quinol monooxygenase [Uliginosibacterium sp. H3]
MSDLIIVAHVTAKPGHETALVAAQKQLVDIVRKQPGCILYDLHESEQQAGDVIFFERWADRTAWENHMNGAHMDAFRAQAGHLIGSFELSQMRQIA